MNRVVVRPDLVVYCTGYRHDFEFLSKDYLRPSAGNTSLAVLFRLSQFP
jgi:hypothetical protein